MDDFAEPAPFPPFWQVCPEHFCACHSFSPLYHLPCSSGSFPAVLNQTLLSINVQNRIPSEPMGNPQELCT